MPLPPRPQPSRLRRIWTAAGAMDWTGSARFAPYLQLVLLLLATTQLVLGCYIWESLLQYSKWIETCYSVYAHDPDFVPQIERPPFTMYAQEDQFTDAKKQLWIGNFSALHSRGYMTIYALIIPLSTLLLACIVAASHFLTRVSLSLRMGLYFSLWQLFDLAMYLYFTGTTLTVDWPFEETKTGFKNPNACFVSEERGKVIQRWARTREGCLGARRGVAVVAGFVAMIYLLLTILAISQSYRRVRKAQHTYAANLRLQELQASDTSRLGRDNDQSYAEATPLPESPRKSGEVSHRRTSTESWVLENDPFIDFADLSAAPVRAQDMV